MNYYDFAIKDYKNAKILYSMSDDYDGIVVLGQQYFEKAFKHLLELKCGEISKVHKITVLLNKLQITEFSSHEDYFRKIQDYYFDKRYPGDCYIETTKEECDYLMGFIEEMKPIIEHFINLYSNNEGLKSSNMFDDI